MFKFFSMGFLFANGRKKVLHIFLYFNIHPANGVNQDQNQDLQDQEGD